MDQPSQGSITQALAEGGHPNVITEKSFNRFRDLWASIAQKIIPSHRRRVDDVEGAVQETLRELRRQLDRQHTFTSSEDIRKWGCRVVSCNAKDILEANRRTEGASACTGSTGRDALQDAGTAIDNMASRQMTGDPPPDIVAQESEVQLRYDALNRQIETELLNWPSPDREIVERWLDSAPFKVIAAEFGVTVYNVRDTTFDFKSRPHLGREANGIRDDLVEAERRWPRLADRLTLRGRAARLLMDFREEP